MVYNPSIPQPGDFLSVSQLQLLQNYSQLYRQFFQNHVSLDDGMVENRGKHTNVHLLEQGADPATAAGEVAVYTKDNGGSTELYRRAPSSGTVIRLTEGAELATSLQVGAFVVCDSQGNILQDKNKNNLAYNVSSVTPGAVVSEKIREDDFTVNFTNALSTNNYFWVVEGYATTHTNLVGIIIGGQINAPVVINPFHNASYADTVKTTSIRFRGYHLNNDVSPKTTSGLVETLRVTIYLAVA